MTLLNYWHYIVLAIIFIIFISGIISALKQEKKKLVIPMLFSTILISLFLAIFSIFIVDKYTKVVKLYKLKNKRLLSTEQIIYSGIVKNEGDFKLGKVTFEIKLVNKGHATGNVKGGNFFKPSGLSDMFSLNADRKNKPQSITKEFVVAKNLKPGAAKSFRVHFRYPGYFRSVAHFAKVTGH